MTEQAEAAKKRVQGRCPSAKAWLKSDGWHVMSGYGSQAEEMTSTHRGSVESAWIDAASRLTPSPVDATDVLLHVATKGDEALAAEVREAAEGKACDSDCQGCIDEKRDPKGQHTHYAGAVEHPTHDSRCYCRPSGMCLYCKSASPKPAEGAQEDFTSTARLEAFEAYSGGGIRQSVVLADTAYGWKERAEKAEAELRAVDAMLERRPAVADAPNRCTAIGRAFTEAGKVLPLVACAERAETRLSESAAREAALTEVVAAGHNFLRATLGLGEDAPRRFDYYAQEFEAREAALRERVEELEKWTLVSDKLPPQTIDVWCASEDWLIQTGGSTIDGEWFTREGDYWRDRFVSMPFRWRPCVAVASGQAGEREA